jgi:hypothetical protein
VATRDLLESLDGVLVAGLFEETKRELQFAALRWQFGRGLVEVANHLGGRKGDLLCFGVAITHQGKRLCEAGRCPNWSYVWTPRMGDRFIFEFRQNGNVIDCHFRWVS